MATLDPVFSPRSLAGPAPVLEAASAHVWLVPLETPLAPCAAILSLEEQARAARMSHAGARDTFRHARTALRLILGHYLGTDPAALPLALGPHGKPWLDLPHAPQFNLSHSGALALLAVTADAPVGIDLEIIRPVSRMERLAETYFAPSEIAALASLPEAARLDAFHACWTRKEAFVKTSGAGLLTNPLSGFDVSLTPYAPADLRAIGGDRAAAEAFTLHAFRPQADTWASICIARRDVGVRFFQATSDVA